MRSPSNPDHHTEAAAHEPETRAGGLLGLPLRGLTGLAEILGGIALLALMFLTVSDALLRSFADRPIFGSGDLVQVLLVAVVASSIPLCIAAGRAIAIEFIVNLLPVIGRNVLQRASAAASAAVLFYLAWRCQVNSAEAAMFGETTMLLQIPFGPFYTALAASFALSGLLFLVDMVRGSRPR